MATLAAINGDISIRKASSSGGVFSALASTIINKGGIVYGACFTDKWSVTHTSTGTIDGLRKFRSSKYVQSKIGDVYLDVKKNLQRQRYVMFTGTPCQISGLRKFLKKDYPMLFTVEIACHGVPSPEVWRSYLNHFLAKGDIENISFRDKSRSWEGYRLTIKDKRNHTLYSKQSIYDPYMSCFLRHLSIRPSCFSCKSKAGRSGADILLGDLWGCAELAPSYNDHQGASLVLVYSDKGMTLVAESDLYTEAISYANATKYNSAILKSVAKPDDRALFGSAFSECSDGFNVIKEFGKPLAPSKYIIMKTRIAGIINKMRRI